MKCIHMILSSSNPCNNNNCISNAPSVLIVDDDIDTLSVVRRLLIEYAFNRCCFTKPAVALEHYKTNQHAEVNSLLDNESNYVVLLYSHNKPAHGLTMLS